MPQAFRPNKQAEKIVYDILGKPASLENTESPYKFKDTSRRLRFDEENRNWLGT